MKKRRSQKLSVYLIQRDVVKFEHALKDKSSVLAYKVKGTLKLDARIFVGRTKSNPAKWVDLLQQGTDKQIDELKNSSNRAVLFLKSNGRMYALPFGFGKYLIKDDAIEREFGLKTVLNIVDPDKLRSLNKANLDDLSLLTSSQSSRRAKPQDFQIDIIRDLLRGVTGEPFPDFHDLGATVTGNEGVNFVAGIDFEGIEPVVSRIGNAYRGKRYKSRFGWVDNVKPIRDASTIVSLQEHLVNDLRAQRKDIIHLSAPVIIDWENYEGFSFTQKGEMHVDLNIETYYLEKKSSLGELTWDRLKSQRLFVKYGDNDKLIPTSFLRSLNYQKEVKGVFFVFAFGEWYSINKKFSDETLEYVKSVKESAVKFIKCDADWDEEKYNKELHRSNPQYHLFDRKLVKSDAFRSSVEVCDIFADEREFVHIKFKSSSATLSHLFSQGRISCTLLARDISFRKNLRRTLVSLGIQKSVIPEKEEEIDTSNYTVTFAIIGGGTGGFVENLPFFSLLNFRLTVTELRSLGFKVKVKKISYK